MSGDLAARIHKRAPEALPLTLDLALSFAKDIVKGLVSSLGVISCVHCLGR